MKERVCSIAVILCMVISMLATSALAAEPPRVIFQETLVNIKVGESVQLKFEATGGTPTFKVSPKASGTLDETGMFTALKSGRVEIEASIDGKYAGMCIIMVANDQTVTAPTVNKKLWPFVPSSENTTNGKIHSGWYTIYSHDMGMLAISDSGKVNPSRNFQNPFYIEHLGNEVYYIYEAYGKYLGWQGGVAQGSQIIVSTTPYKWKIEQFYDWQKKYRFTTNENTDYVLSVYGTCSGTEDSMARLGYYGGLNVPNHFFTLDSLVPEQMIPQWYKDLQAGKSAPTLGKEQPKRFGDVPVGLKNTTQEEWDVLRLTNIERAKAGLTMFVTFDALQKAAGVRGDEMPVLYEHTRPNGSKAYTALSENGISHSSAAENIAMGAPNAEEVVLGWMNSPGHKANILTAKLRYMGTGFTNEGTPYWVQLFAANDGSDCASITYNETLGYFVLTLKNGITAYAPYDPVSSPTDGESVAFNYPGVGTIKAREPQTMADGWYNLNIMGNYINLTSEGKAQLNKRTTNQAFYIENTGAGQITLKTADGTYLGVGSTIKDGTQVTAVTTPYAWRTYLESGQSVFSLRPAAKAQVLLNASEQKNTNGTKIILWTHENLDAPGHAEIRFEAAKKPEEQKKSPRHPFIDVASGSYYEDAVVWALKTGVTSGTSATTFAPTLTCTRGQVVTFLWRSNFSPEPKMKANPFTDVKESDYYYKAVLWAVEEGITSGTSATTFSPDATCSGGQVITFLWRANGTPAAKGESKLAAVNPGQYYTDAVAWAESTKLLEGTDIPFSPNSNTSRADIVTYLFRDAGSLIITE